MTGPGRRWRGGQLLGRQARRWRFRPPVVSRAWPPAPPDFVGVGVQRAGTSWWYSLLEAHPQVHGLSSARKELHFFDRFSSTEFGAAELAAYHGRFRRPPDRLCGEWTPRYLLDPWVPPLLRQAAPDAKLLVLLRDPLERFRSGLAHAIERQRSGPDVVEEAFARGFYHQQLMRMLRHFPRDQLLVLQFEACVLHPAEMVDRTFGFLGVDPTAHRRPESESRARNATKGPGLQLPPALADALRRSYEDDVRHLVAAFPEIDPSLWPNFGHLAAG